MLLPSTPSDVEDIVKSHSALLPVGGGSKPALSGGMAEATRIAMGHLRGITEYDPDEYTLTALAGTPIREILDVVEGNQQYLPFDPLFVKRGATLGGSIAANTSGPGRYRYGGMRDFILGVRFVDGLGRSVRGGGKVVKNASGFDLPKFMVGSLGRFGIMTEVTIKIFPRPKRYTTLMIQYPTLQAAIDAVFALSNQPFEMDALDIEPGAHVDDPARMAIRIGGLPESLADRADRLSRWLSAQTRPDAISEVGSDKDIAYWSGLNQMAWVDPTHCLVKVPLAPRQLIPLKRSLPGKMHISVGGHVAWLAVPIGSIDEVDTALLKQKLPAQLIQGPAGRPYLGYQGWLPMAERVKRALDPHGKFLKLDQSVRVG